jgi:hypothetical protein
MVMRVCVLALWAVLVFPQPAFSEIWDFSCTEAVSLLKTAQERVVRKHDQLQEAKFGLRHSPQKFDGCRRTRRGFQGGEIHCVTHQSKQGILLKEILIAQQSLDASIQEFKKYQQGLLLSCVTNVP